MPTPVHRSQFLDLTQGCLQNLGQVLRCHVLDLHMAHADQRIFLREFHSLWGCTKKPNSKLLSPTRPHSCLQTQKPDTCLCTCQWGVPGDGCFLYEFHWTSGPAGCSCLHSQCLLHLPKPTNMLIQWEKKKLKKSAITFAKMHMETKRRYGLPVIGWRFVLLWTLQRSSVPLLTISTTNWKEHRLRMRMEKQLRSIYKLTQHKFIRVSLRLWCPRIPPCPFQISKRKWLGICEIMKKYLYFSFAY